MNLQVPTLLKSREAEPGIRSLSALHHDSFGMSSSCCCAADRFGKLQSLSWMNPGSAAILPLFDHLRPAVTHSLITLGSISTFPLS
jgi:hypothetical protein